MKSNDAKQQIEYIGIIVLILSVIFLGYELKRSNDIAAANATAASYAEANEFLFTMISDRKLLEIWEAGVRDVDSLAEEDMLIFSYQLTLFYNGREVDWRNYENGVMSEEDINFRIAEMCQFINSHPKIQAGWTEYRVKTVLPGFVRYVGENCELVKF